MPEDATLCPLPIPDLWAEATRQTQQCLADLRSLQPAKGTEPDLQWLCNRLKAISVAVSCLKQIQDGQRKLAQEASHDAHSDAGDAAVARDFAQEVERIFLQMHQSIEREDASDAPEDPLSA